jgi:DNA-binding Lrp family transcriptional regulator
MNDVDKIDIGILSIMETLNKTSPLFSIQIKDIMEKLKFKYDVSYPTVIRRLQNLIKKEYVGEGYKLGNSRNFYLSNKGISLIQDIKEKEDVYIEIVDNTENNNGEELKNE